MYIWIDADACPKAIKAILFRAANRIPIKIILVANQFLATPASDYITTVQVAAGFDVADQYIMQQVRFGDIVITADLPLADGVVAQGAIALNPRGELYTKENIKQRLAIRNLNAELRSSGMAIGGPASLTNKDIQAFANSLDRLLNRYL